KKSSAPSMTERDLARMNRRELLKLTPLILLGAFAVPKLQDKLLEKGVALSDWASGIYFSKSRLARTFKDSEVVPFEKFPYNGYDVIDPEVDLDNWTLRDRKSTRLNSSHDQISYAVFCLKKKK